MTTVNVRTALERKQGNIKATVAKEKSGEFTLIDDYLYVISRPVLMKKHLLIDALMSLTNGLISESECV